MAINKSVSILSFVKEFPSIVINDLEIISIFGSFAIEIPTSFSLLLSKKVFLTTFGFFSSTGFSTFF